MIKNRRNAKLAMDGMVVRRQRGTVGSFSAKKNTSNSKQSVKLDTFEANEASSSRDISEVNPDYEINFSDLNETEQRQIKQKKRWWQFWRSKKPNQKLTVKRFIKKFSLIAAVAALLIGFFIGSRIFFAARNIIDRSGNCPAILCGGEGTALKGEGDGRINILIIGIGGEGHDGGMLADTIMVASLDPFEKEVALLSVPRDMYVDIPGYESTKINASHAYGEEYDFKEDGYPEGGVGLLQKTIEQTLDIPIHYYLRGDFAGFETAVDAVGGLTINVDEAVYDNNFYSALGGPLDIPEGKYTFNGTMALFYARSRYTSSRGDFSRNDRQRDILLALKDKALSAGTLSDPTKLVGLINAAGSHVRTNIQPAEIIRLYEIMGEVSKDKIISVGLDTSENNYLAGDTINGASVLIPKAGDYSEIKKYVRSVFVDGYIRSENAEVAILNGSELFGIATQRSEELVSYGYNVVSVNDAARSDYPQTIVYDLSGGNKKFTKQLLEQRLGITMLDGAQKPSDIDIDADFLIILGNNETLEAESSQN